MPYYLDICINENISYQITYFYSKNKKNSTIVSQNVQNKSKFNNFNLKRQSMQKKILFFTLIVLIGISTNFAYSQEMSHATFQETAQIVIDKSISQNVTASITLQSTSIQEIKIPAELEQKIREDKRITAIIYKSRSMCSRSC